MKDRTFFIDQWSSNLVEFKIMSKRIFLIDHKQKDQNEQKSELWWLDVAELAPVNPKRFKTTGTVLVWTQSSLCSFQKFKIWSEMNLAEKTFILHLWFRYFRKHWKIVRQMCTKVFAICTLNCTWLCKLITQGLHICPRDNRPRLLKLWKRL